MVDGEVTIEGRQYRLSTEAGLVDGMSFRFDALDDTPADTPKCFIVRIFRQAFRADDSRRELLPDLTDDSPEGQMEYATERVQEFLQGDRHFWKPDTTNPRTAIFTFGESDVA